ncbi:MAG: isocitrate/isopropylmalate family dehydrogenase [candidate division KSB1 bacterium]|nr:isocitrate/isopropylmalate family dehydrogenase [candidate division KSB1 bacterium]MDZ7273888.1 isocitrate/isopropylmalate family dehydrogenase [candidate division KSB1 bacterium]MDZ7286044.1 isocitrate/isopropylmalate family dehydrogenase [candidate division KSB1 bacterium]MDZ7299076.1 isocitrate/isopropylmalate family dehydrogenase [candidate division KSB1 bacterium]MDZ7306379.1 isocitrate/isopropylmalate family dehydrogenase [candidate division KSB1 bacterium]
MHKVTLIPGDGIGPAIIEAAVMVLEAAGVKIEWDRQLAGMAAVEQCGTPIPESTLASLRQTRVALKGPLTTPVGGGYRSVNVALRQEFKLYANVRPAVSFAGTRAIHPDVDLVIIRENTEGLYSGIEHFITADGVHIAAESTALITRSGSEKILRYAFEYARHHKRRRVTLVHKANILKCTTGMFLEIGRALAHMYPDLEFNDKIIDACAMQMVMTPAAFDVIVTTNLFGDILSDLAAGLVGGLGLTAGANIGRDAAIFEAVHGSAPDLAGKNLANPTAVIMAGVMMLDHLGEYQAARRIEQAVRRVIREGKAVTPDLNRQTPVSTAEMAAAIVAAL